MEETCRICLSPADEQPLLTPCRCAGTMAHVHERCVLAWHARTATAHGTQRCDTCGTEFTTGSALDGQTPILLQHYATYLRHVWRAATAGMWLAAVASAPHLWRLVIAAFFFQIFGTAVQSGREMFAVAFSPDLELLPLLAFKRREGAVLEGVSEAVCVGMRWGPAIVLGFYLLNACAVEPLRVAREAFERAKAQKATEEATEEARKQAIEGSEAKEDREEKEEEAPQAQAPQAQAPQAQAPQAMAAAPAPQPPAAPQPPTSDVAAAFGVLSDLWHSLFNLGESHLVYVVIVMCLVSWVPISLCVAYRTVWLAEHLSVIGSVLLAMKVLKYLNLGEIPKPWLHALSDYLDWEPQTFGLAVFNCAVLFMAHRFVKRYIPALRRLCTEGGDLDLIGIAWETYTRLLPRLVTDVALPYVYGVGLAYAATGSLRVPNPGSPLAWAFWLVGVVGRWDLKTARRIPAKPADVADNTSYVGKIASFVSQKASLTPVVCDLVPFAATSAVLLLLRLPGSLGFSLTAQHLPLVLVALLTPAAPRQPPLAWVALQWLNERTKVDRPKPKQADQSDQTIVQPELRPATLVFVLCVLPLLTGRAMFATSDVFSWLAGLALELPLLGLYLKHTPSTWLQAARSTLPALIFERRRSLVTSALCLALSCFVPLHWTLRDAAFRVLALAWPREYYGYLVLAFTATNGGSVYEVLDMAMVSGEWRLPLDLFHEVMRATYPHGLLNYQHRISTSTE